MSSRLQDIERSIDQLDPADQVRLLEYLAPRIARLVLASRSQAQEDADAAWRRYREVGQRLAATSVPVAPSLTQAVSEMRR